MTDLAPITPAHVEKLHAFDAALAEGPDWVKLAVQGAVVGGVLSLVSGFPLERGSAGHAVKYGAAGAAIALGGVFALFQIGRMVSERSHEAVAEAAVRGDFAGWTPLEFHSHLG